MNEFNVGDVVKLVSGGPVMTISSYRGDNEFICQWFDHANVLQFGTFPAKTLKVVASPTL
jgi:uncharacterized protein YodC (DUF2158 family)